MKSIRALAPSAVAAALLAIAVSPAAHANLIVNGSFENSPFTGNGNYQLGLVGNAVTGWFIPASDGVYPWGLQNGAFGASTPYGNQFFVLGEATTQVPYTIQQTLTGLTVNSTYNLSFAIASELGCCSTVEVSYLSGSATPTQNFLATLSGQYWTDWTTQQTSFVANNSSVTLQFRNINLSTTNGNDIGLDNVVVEAAGAVPEPETYALMLAGLGLLGFVARRRKQKAA